MIHFTCDACKQPVTGRRYIVRVETYEALEPVVADPDTDPLTEMAQELDAVIGNELADTLSDEGTRQFRFDLCPNCHRRFLRDPVAASAPATVRFSSN